MAWHWRRLGRGFELLTRVGTVDGGPIKAFLDRHGIRTVSRAELAAPGASSAIDIEILPDRQPHMDNFVAGVWEDYRLTARERESLRTTKRLHVVLVEGAIAELARLAARRRARGHRGLRGLPRLPPLHGRAPRRHHAPRRPRVHRLAGRRGRPDGGRHARGRPRPPTPLGRDDGCALGVDLRRPAGHGQAARAPLPGGGGRGRRDHAGLRRCVHRLVPRRALAQQRSRHGRRAGHDWRRTGHGVVTPPPRRRVR